jgi:hypothetical protein
MWLKLGRRLPTTQNNLLLIKLGRKFTRVRELNHRTTQHGLKDNLMPHIVRVAPPSQLTILALELLLLFCPS